ncbi:SIMPL domain-containing protein [Bacillus sp. FJAT-49705]|uniref:SIMPL domain-containing protein n=1 Tax=Cytobacillus citreus TaxID=2833586 RepID=A0ABS5NUK0_9BACI|nr:SIMPL domain-containing protein [Cytobacillus citreus]MBS4191241.1 SIMPL domain-containing protein [Cytobacillus citreus]
MYYQQPSNRNTQTIGSKRNIIRVTGEGKVYAKPDKAEITLGASTEDKQLEVAQKNNAMIISKIKKGLNQLGIQDEQIKTVNYSIFPQYDYVEGKQIFRGYKVEHLLQISINDIENAGLVVDTAVKNGANVVSRIRFSVGDSIQYEQQALSIAVINAYQKADTIARTLGVQLNKVPILVAEIGRQRGEPIPFQMTALVKSEAATPIQPGTLEMRSQVSAEFEFHS